MEKRRPGALFLQFADGRRLQLFHGPLARSCKAWIAWRNGAECRRASSEKRFMRVVSCIANEAEA
jgi:hypothetical protein